MSNGPQTLGWKREEERKEGEENGGLDNGGMAVIVELPAELC